MQWWVWPGHREGLDADAQEEGFGYEESLDLVDRNYRFAGIHGSFVASLPGSFVAGSPGGFG